MKIATIKPNKDCIDLTRRILDQNEMIIRANTELLKLLAMPPRFIEPEKKP